jgi:hypothetical protein
VNADKNTANLTIKNCVFEDLEASGLGGAVFYLGGSGGRLEVRGSEFRRVKAQSGGALYGNLERDALITGVVIDGAEAKGMGGAIRLRFNSNGGGGHVELRNVVIRNVTTGSGDAVSIDD